MKCPKCGFFGPDHLDTCKKCGEDLSAEKERLGLTLFRPRGFRARNAASRQPLPAETILEETPHPGVQGAKPTDEIEAKLEPMTPEIVSPVEEPKEIIQKDLDFPQPPVNLQTEQQETPSVEATEETFQLEAEEDFDSAPLEKTLNISGLEQDTAPGKDTSDDFEFPDFVESKSSFDAVSAENDGFSTTVAMPDPDLGEGSTEPLAATESDGGLSDEETLVDEKISLGEDDVSLPTDDLLRQEREDSGTVALKPEEVEDILQSEIPSLDESAADETHDASKTELLDADELSKILDDLDTDSSKPDNNS